MPIHESIKFFENPPDDFYRVSIGSYAYEFLPHAISDTQKTDFRNVLTLGCGHGLDLVALRIFLGDGARLIGVDNASELFDGSQSSREREANFHVAGADFMFSDMHQIDKILAKLDSPPNLITIRHPGRMTEQQEYEEIENRLMPWIVYSHEFDTTLLLSMCRMHRSRRDQLVKTVIKKFGKERITVLDKITSKYTWYSDNLMTTFHPDFAGLRIN